MLISRCRVFALLSCVFMAGIPGLKAQSPITLQVDATQAPAEHYPYPDGPFLFHPGRLTLYYPKWIPGEHAPDGPIVNVAGLKFTANGKAIPWRRDLVDMFAFHLDIPQGVSVSDVSFDYVEPVSMPDLPPGHPPRTSWWSSVGTRTCSIPPGIPRRTHLQANAEASRRLEIRHGASGGQAEGNGVIEFKPVSLKPPGGFARHRRPVLPGGQRDAARRADPSRN